MHTFSFLSLIRKENKIYILRERSRVQQKYRANTEPKTNASDLFWFYYLLNVKKISAIFLKAVKFGPGLRSQFWDRGAVSKMNQKPEGKSPETRGNGRCVASRFRSFFVFFRRHFQAQIPAQFFLFYLDHFFFTKTTYVSVFIYVISNIKIWKTYS